MEEGGENSTSTASSKIAELVLNGMKRASALEKYFGDESCESGVATRCRRQTSAPRIESK